jgi:pyruvate kinase
MKALIEAGVDVVRLNLSHGTIEEHRARAQETKALAEEARRAVGVLVDLPGPKPRTGPVKGDVVALEPGASFRLTAREVAGDSEGVGTSIEDLAEIVEPGDEIFLADGEIVLTVTAISGEDVVTSVVRGGALRSHKGMHLPAAELKMQAFTEQDERALRSALDMEADLIAVSFVRNAEDMKRALDALPTGENRPLLVAKIETRSALDDLDAIVAASDVVMVARGDLGIQIPLQRVPLVQKEIISVCNSTGTPVITATEMLESMVHSPLPTRAEAGDVANAILDGTDALMLSEETAVGEFPIETVETMSKVAEAADAAASERALFHEPEGGEDPVSWAVAHAAVQAAEDLGVAAILCPTQTGATARRVSAFRPHMPIMALASDSATLGGLTVTWGVRPHRVAELPRAATIAEECDRAVQAARAAGMVNDGDLVTVVAGTPGPRAGRTDFVRVVRA